MVVDSTQFFEDDDADTLDLLLSSAADDDMKTYLDGLVVRFLDDAKEPSDERFWNRVSKSTEELGFCMVCTLPVPSPATPAGSVRHFLQRSRPIRARNTFEQRLVC
jgi:hypothetical protein